MKRTISVIAPAFNEAPNLPELVDRLQQIFAARGLRGEIVLVDDGSTDDTPSVIDDLAATAENVVAVHHEQNSGIEAGWRSGLEASSGSLICLIDSDLQYVPEDVWRLYREFLASPDDMIQGYRSTVARDGRDPRYQLSRGLNLMLNLLFGMRLRDNKSGFVLCRRAVLEDALDHRYRYRYFQTFIAVAAVAKGYSVREIEVLFQERLLGTSFIRKFPLRIVGGVLLDLGKAFVEFRLGRLPAMPASLQAYIERTQPPDRSARLPLPRRLWFRLYAGLLPLHHWFITRRAASRYRELRRTQWLPADRVRELQELKLRKLVHHAYGHVAYYRELFDDRGLKPPDIDSIEDLQKLPFLTKDHVRRHLFFDLLSDNHNKRDIQRIATSGSTGEPFVCYVDRHQLEMRWAATMRSMEWTGWRFGDRQVRLWHQTIGLSRAQIWRERLDAAIQRRKFIPAFELTDESLAEFGRQLASYEPTLIDGYAESLNFLAEYLKRHELGDVRPQGVISSAQVLPPQSREVIERQFGCGVHDKYGAREFSGIAYECEAHTGHHVVAENYIVEIIKDGRQAEPGEVGEVVVTDLNNYCMPFIRYRIGDLATAADPAETCPCGRGLPLVGAIEGRVQSIIMGTNGRYLPGTFFAHFFKDHDHIVRQYQVVQEKEGAMQLKVVKGARFQQDAFESILDELRGYVGGEMDIQLEFRDSIPMVRTGKQQGSVSRLGLSVADPGSGESVDAEPLVRGR
ncbi:MAG: glycosyltransferase [Solirubrobacterales bacterium]